MKNVLAFILLSTFSFAGTEQKITVPAPKFQAGELIVGKAKFKSGFYAYNDKKNPVTAARVQVDPISNLISVKWYTIQTLPTNGLSLKSLLSTREFKIPLNQITSPVLFLGASNLTDRNQPIKTIFWAWTGGVKTITKDPYIAVHEEQYQCIREKNACYRVNGNNSTVDMKLAITSSMDGQTLNFMTDYEYTVPPRVLETPCSESGGYGYSICQYSKPEKVKYNAVTLDEYDIQLAYTVYRDSLVDIIDRTASDFDWLYKNRGRIWKATQSCFYKISMGVENQLTSKPIESIHGEGIDQRCFQQELSSLRIRFSPEQLTGFFYSAEQQALGKSLNEIESNCPYEVWTGPRNSYTIFQKQCIEAGFQKLEMKLEQVSSELKRYIK